MIKNVIKKGNVYKVLCFKTGEKTLLINCHDCERNKGYDPIKNTIRCEAHNENR